MEIEEQIIIDSEIEKYNKQLKETVLQYFADREIQIPLTIKNCIEDVFSETDFLSETEDNLNIYFKEDLVEFETDTMITTIVNVQVHGGNSAGYHLTKYTYYGELLTTPEAYTKQITLFNGEEDLVRIDDFMATETNKLVDPNDFCIVVIYDHSFEMGDYTVTPRLYIYLPLSGEGVPV